MIFLREYLSARRAIGIPRQAYNIVNAAPDIKNAIEEAIKADNIFLKDKSKCEIK